VWSAYLDASALAKKYVPEPGTATVQYLFTRVSADRQAVLTVGVAEVVSVFVRRRNANWLTPAAFAQAMAAFTAEIIGPTPPLKLAIDPLLVSSALAFIATHSLNGTDAIVLRSALNLAAQLRAVGEDLFLAACDLRLIGAAQAEGLTTFDPERQTQADLDAILGP
jgi:uncharacterized protein